MDSVTGLVQWWGGQLSMRKFVMSFPYVGFNL